MNNDHKITRVDYLIVGASAAGSLLAAKFANKGKTMFVDKYLPGSRMNCGGGMPEKVLKAFGVDIPFFPIKKAVMNIKGRECRFPCNYVVVDRSEFNHALYEKACLAGAEFCQMNYRRHDPKQKIASFTKNKKTKQIAYKKLILAYGFHPFVEPFSGQKRECPFGIARVQIINQVSPHPKEFYFYIYSGDLPGYHWIFPMPGGKSNIGSGGFKKTSIESASIKDLKNIENLEGEVMKKGGGVLPLSNSARIQQKDSFLFGDSAGMVNALNGEGLMHIANFADKFVDGVVKNKNMNLIWNFSGTYWYLLIAAIVLRLMIFLSRITKIPFYALACRSVAFIRRSLG